MITFAQNFYIHFIIIIAVCSCAGSSDKLKRDFKNPPKTFTTGCYWYWLSDNITKEGAVKDLHAMKRAGINSAFIGHIGKQTSHIGNIKIFSDEWYDIIHTVLKTASELDIEIGMFNSPGWSQSGGPWILPGESMRYLVASETRLVGKGEITVRLPVPSSASRMAEWSDRFTDSENRPSADFQDVRVLAFPIPSNYGQNLLELPDTEITVSDKNMLPSSVTKIKYMPRVSDSSNISLRYALPKGKSAINIKLSSSQAVRSLTVYPAGYISLDAELQVKTDGRFQTVKQFILNRQLPMLHVGHVPFAPVAVSLPETVSDEYRIIFNNKADIINGAGKIILSPSPVLNDYPEKTLAKLYQGDSPDWDYYRRLQPRDEDLTGLAPQTKQIIDITEFMSPEGILRWNVPEGEWLVLRTGMVPTYIENSPAVPEATGLEMDKMSRSPIEKHFDSFIGEIIRRIPSGDRKTFKVMVEDSWEKAGQNFTDNFLNTFKSHYGYDATPYLPVLTGYVVGNENISDRFLWDVRRLAAELEASENVGGLTETANKHGLSSWLENYGDWGFPGETLLYGKYADRVGGEFWEDQKKPYISLAASCAHIYNKPCVYAESFTSSSDPFRHSPQTLKRFADEAFAEGMTRAVLHVYIQQAYEEIFPGLDAWFGVEFNRKNTWFSHLDEFTTYLKRCGFMLEHGLNVADIACFIGEDVPVNSGPFDMKNKTGKAVPDVPSGYRFDYVNSDVIINYMKVENGLLTLPHGISYRILVLPESKTMRPELLQKIEQLVAGGAAIIGSPPETSPSLAEYPEADKKVKQLSEKIWNSQNGNVFSGATLEEVFQKLDISPDFQSDAENILFTHRTDSDREIYFLSNQNACQVQFTPEFRVKGKSPEIWNPVTCEISPMNEKIKLAPYESTFVVFENTVRSKNIRPLQTVAEITGPWTVEFQSDSINRGPASPVNFDELTDWSQNSNDSIKYYSGTAVYKTKFNFSCKSIARNSTAMLEFEKVGAMTKVRINGKNAGGIWTPPYRVRIDGLLREGENTVEIEVVNNWINRLTGDRLLPKEERRVESPQFRQTSPLQESGLIGKVRVIAN